MYVLNNPPIGYSNLSDLYRASLNSFHSHAQLVLGPHHRVPQCNFGVRQG